MIIDYKIPNNSNNSHHTNSSDKENKKFSNGCLKIIYRYFNQSNPKGRFLHISGENGIGKSTLVREYLRYTFSDSNQSLDKNYYLIDIEGSFKKSNFSQDPVLKCNEDKIFRADVSNLHDLTKMLGLLNNQIFPIQHGEILIINSISKLLKVEVGNVEDYYEYIHALEYFTTEIVPKLVNLAVKRKIFIVLIHHVSYNPLYESNLTYYNDLMRTMAGMWIYMQKFPVIMNYDNDIAYNYFLTLFYQISEYRVETIFHRHMKKIYQFICLDGRFLCYSREISENLRD